jgi:hypothetical protein
MPFYYGNADFTCGVIKMIVQVEIAEETDPKFKTGSIAIAHMTFVEGMTGQ